MSQAGGAKIFALGELLLRLSPPDRLQIRQATCLNVEVGGAEANVLASLAALGHETALASCLPVGALGDLAQSAIAGLRIGTADIRRGAGRMGLYFLEAGHGRRAARIVYDRTGSAFSQSTLADFDFDALLDGASLLHLSGITPALGQQSAELALGAAQAANRLGVPVSFDGNFRAQLWQLWNDQPAPILKQLISSADILIGNHRDIALVTGKTFDGEGEQRRDAAAAYAFEVFPRLQLIASTARRVIESERHAISARVDRRDGNYQTEEIEITSIIDRIGTGDAYAAGVLHGWISGWDLEKTARAGLALCVLKHGVHGDAAAFTEDDISDFWQGSGDVRR